MSTPLLSDEKHTHLAHKILAFLQEHPRARVIGPPPAALKEIKRVLSEQIKLEQDIDAAVRARLNSYARQAPEGSQEWDVLYRKTYAEELRKRNLG